MHCEFAVPGLSFAAQPAERAHPAPRCTLRQVADADLATHWPPTGASRVAEEHFPGDLEPARTIDVHPHAGYRLYARHFGQAVVSADGASVACAPPEEATWRWQRFLMGRILPLAAVARGIECFHASAVTVGDRALAFTGPSGAGKTSLAAIMAMGGAGYLTDDVLALEPRDGEVIAHPGSAVASLRPTEEVLLDTEGPRLGHVLGRDDKTYVAVDRPSPARPLAALYFLTAERRAHPIAPLVPADPRLLLASTFILTIRTRERLANQLHVCAALAAAVPMFTLSVAGSPHGPGALAKEVRSHAEAQLERGA